MRNKAGQKVNRSSKKQKPKKPPQRGLGVAQLERLRLEEQRKKDPASFCPLPSAFTLSPSFSAFSSCPSQGARLMYYVPEYGLKVNGNEQATQLSSYQSEPPSNQSHVAPVTPWEEKVPSGCAKRSYPCSFENPPAPYFPFKLHKVGNPIMNISEELSPFSGIDKVLREHFKEGPSRSSSVLDSSSMDIMKENKVSDGGYIAVANPADIPPSQHLASSSSRRYDTRPGSEFLPYLGYPVGFVYRHAPRWTDQPQRQPPFRQPYYNFFLPMTAPKEVEDPHDDEDRNDTSKGVDLELKL